MQLELFLQTLVSQMEMEYSIRRPGDVFDGGIGILAYILFKTKSDIQHCLTNEENWTNNCHQLILTSTCAFVL